MQQQPSQWPGIGGYSFVASAPCNSQAIGSPLFAQATYQLGVTNLVTCYGGVAIASGYVSAILRAAFNMPFGTDITQMTLALDAKRFNGSRAQVGH
ncbi:fimbria/pilus outer membrane usher protein [Burkholderia sp. BE17]|uniref:fimbria/pilus outer membrane usher protein n=1 Tax=Burkholderia sp. BE17 TaxID=2656644 RepID=UPI00187B3BF1|nr:fimbria/pilus outer membrane usher protein [Burkholderia sp. BE17]